MFTYKKVRGSDAILPKTIHRLLDGGYVPKSRRPDELRALEKGILDTYATGRIEGPSDSGIVVSLPQLGVRAFVPLEDYDSKMYCRGRHVSVIVKGVISPDKVRAILASDYRLASD